jgi:uncharacterized protein
MIRAKWLLICCSTTVVAHAASFDCKKASTPQEKAICGSPDLSAADDRMAAAYKNLLSGIPADMVSDVRSEQREWVKGLAKDCADDGKMVECLGKKYKTRIEVLQGMLVHQGGVVFVMRDITLLSPDSAADKANMPAGEEENPGFGTLNASWPQAIGPKEVVATPEWRAWNTAVERAAQSMATNEKPEQNSRWKKEWADGVEADLTATLQNVGQGRVSVHLENDIMGHGAAHPNESWMSFHWLLKEQREMKADDVFKPGSGWKRLVDARCVAALKKQFSDQGGAYDDLEKNVAGVTGSPRNWEMDGKGLTIVFPEYSVSPRVEPADPVTIPWSALQPFLSPGFIRPQ